MKKRYIGFPIKDGCHVDGSNLGINKIKDFIKFDKVIKINKYEKDLDTVTINDNILADTVFNILENNELPITIGGDHSLAIGSIAGSSSYNNNLGVIWLDTHPDINTNETTTTFHIHGYPLASSIGFGPKELTALYKETTKMDYKNVVLFGINDIDEPEQELINKLNIKTFTLDYINKNTLEKSLQEAINYLKSKNVNVHLSFDIDSINYYECPGVNVKNRWNNGLTKKEALNSFDTFIKNLPIQSIDIVEYNPLKDIDNKSYNIVKDCISIIERNIK